MIEQHQLILLDTNVLIHLIRGNEVATRIEADLKLSSRQERPLISVVTVGEGLSLARKFGWGLRRTDKLKELMRELVVVDINNKGTLECYAELDHVTEAAGRKMGQNDLWIASTAKATGAHLVTTDKDFDQLHPDHIERTYFEPNLNETSA